MSPDLNPIEDLWHIVSKRVYKSNFTTKAALIATVQAEWAKITAAELAVLYDSMPRRLKAVRKAHGGPTKY